MALTVFTGGFAGAVIGGALLGFSMNATVNIVSQVKTFGWDNINLSNSVKAGLIGAAIGAVSGLFAHSVGLVLQGVGEFAGVTLSQSSQITSVFSSSSMISVLGVTGRITGNIIGAVIGEMLGNDLFNQRYKLEENFGDTISSQIFGWFTDFFKWFAKI